MSVNGHIVSGHHLGSASPFLVAADHPQQYRMLVNMLLQHPHPESRQHARTAFYVADRPIFEYGSDNWPKRWLRVGYCAGFGGALFVDETGDSDWAWFALAADPLDDPPTVYFDQDADRAFPAPAVMPMGELHSVVLEWVRTGQRPRSMNWLTVNSLTWPAIDSST